MYETKYARVSHQKPLVHPLRRAAATASGRPSAATVTIMIATASANHQTGRRVSTSTVFWMSIFQSEVRDREPREERASPTTRTRFSPASCREPGVDAPDGVDRVGMSSSECAGESGSESTSSPARSATGSGGCAG